MTVEAPAKFSKSELLAHWASLPADQPIVPTPVPYKHEGSSYAEDGVRICGTPAFVDAVLSRLKDLLDYEAGATRLQVAYQPTHRRDSGEPTGSVNCYVQVAARGGQSAVAAIGGRAAANARRLGR